MAATKSKVGAAARPEAGGMNDLDYRRAHTDYCRATLGDVAAAILTLIFFAVLLEGFGWVGLLVGVCVGAAVVAVCACMQGAYEDRMLDEWQERQR